jgi:hypothetical protein
VIRRWALRLYAAYLRHQLQAATNERQYLIEERALISTRIDELRTRIAWLDAERVLKDPTLRRSS